LAPLPGISGDDIRCDSVRGLYPRNCAGIVKTVSTSGFGSKGAGGGADEEPFGGAADAAPGGAAFGDAQGVVAFFGEGGGLFLFVGEIALSGGEFGLAGFAVDGEIVEWFQVFGGKDGLGRCGFCVARGGLVSDGGIAGLRRWCSA
jgi:hypothetical protein